VRIEFFEYLIDSRVSEFFFVDCIGIVGVKQVQQLSEFLTLVNRALRMRR
jgi:hypothetical protein